MREQARRQGPGEWTISGQPMYSEGAARKQYRPGFSYQPVENAVREQGVAGAFQAHFVEAVILLLMILSNGRRINGYRH
jgi:hypothetical protein